MTLSQIDVARSKASSRRTAGDGQLALRVATALLITTAAAIVLIYVGLCGNALPADADLMKHLF